MSDTNDAFEQFCNACDRGNLAAAQQLLGSIKDINASNWDDRTPLMCGARSRNVDLVRFLLDNGADVTNHTHFGSMPTPMHMAASVANNVDVLCLLIERRADLHAKNCANIQPVDLAHCHANLRCLLAAGADPERALVAAARTQNVDIIDELINSGVDVDSRGGGEGWTALMSASASDVDSDSASVLRLLAYGANVNAHSNNNQINALGVAVVCGFDATCTQLLAAGADVNAPCFHGAAPLHFGLRLATTGASAYRRCWRQVPTFTCVTRTVV